MSYKPLSISFLLSSSLALNAMETKSAATATPDAKTACAIGTAQDEQKPAVDVEFAKIKALFPNNDIYDLADPNRHRIRPARTQLTHETWAHLFSPQQLTYLEPIVAFEVIEHLARPQGNPPCSRVSNYSAPVRETSYVVVIKKRYY